MNKKDREIILHIVKTAVTNIKKYGQAYMMKYDHIENYGYLAHAYKQEIYEAVISHFNTHSTFALYTVESSIDYYIVKLTQRG